MGRSYKALNEIVEFEVTIILHAFTIIHCIYTQVLNDSIAYQKKSTEIMHIVVSVSVTSANEISASSRNLLPAHDDISKERNKIDAPAKNYALLAAFKPHCSNKERTTPAKEMEINPIRALP